MKDGVDSATKPFHLEFSNPHNYKRMKVRGFVAPECTVTPKMIEALVEVVNESEAHNAKREVEANLLREAFEALKAVGIEDTTYKNYRDGTVRPNEDGSCKVEYYGWGKGATEATGMADMVTRMVTRFGNVVTKVEFHGGNTTYTLRFPRGRVPEAKEAVDMLAAVYEKKPNA